MAELVYYLYDGIFTGLLSAIYTAFKRQERPDKILKNESDRLSLFGERIIIKTDQEKADQVSKAVREQISARALKKIYYAYLSEIENVEMTILHYLELGFETGRGIEQQLTDQRVISLHRISRKVSGERHRMLGLVRFRRLQNGVYYAPLEPDHNIITLLAPHFQKRLSDQPWIIHDLRRELAVIYNQQEWVFTSLQGCQPTGDAGEEKYIQRLWQEFFNSISIQHRENPALQKRFVPIRYWRHLTEMPDE